MCRAAVGVPAEHAGAVLSFDPVGLMELLRAVSSFALAATTIFGSPGASVLRIFGVSHLILTQALAWLSGLEWARILRQSFAVACAAITTTLNDAADQFLGITNALIVAQPNAVELA